MSSAVEYIALCSKEKISSINGGGNDTGFTFCLDFEVRHTSGLIHLSSLLLLREMTKGTVIFQLLLRPPSLLQMFCLVDYLTFM